MWSLHWYLLLSDFLFKYKLIEFLKINLSSKLILKIFLFKLQEVDLVDFGNHSFENWMKTDVHE